MLEELSFQLKHFIKIGNINAALFLIRDVPKASQFELKNNYTNLLIQINGTLQGEQEREYLMVFVSLCKRNFGLAPQYNTAWLRALNNVETALAYLKVNGISLDRLTYLYSHLSFAVWPSLITHLTQAPR